MDMSKYTTATATTKTTTKAPGQLVAFCLYLAENQVRITYKAIDTIRCGRVRNGMPHYSDVLGAIPHDLQWVMCNSTGKYAGKGLETWGQTAPEGFMEFGYIKPDQAVAAYAEWIAGLGE